MKDRDGPCPIAIITTIISRKLPYQRYSDANLRASIHLPTGKASEPIHHGTHSSIPLRLANASKLGCIGNHVTARNMHYRSLQPFHRKEETFPADSVHPKPPFKSETRNSPNALGCVFLRSSLETFSYNLNRVYSSVADRKITRSSVQLSRYQVQHSKVSLIFSIFFLRATRKYSICD